MESSETRAARLGAERCRDRALEERGVAPGKKNAARLGAHIVFADESGFLLIPTEVRTWAPQGDRKSTRLNSSHSQISYAVFCLKTKKQHRGADTAVWLKDDPVWWAGC